MKSILSFWSKLAQHKVLTGFIILIVVVAGYYWYQKATATPAQTKYVLAAVTKGTLISSVSGTGQVLASNQTDVKPKVSGDVVSAPVTQGQHVYAGQLIAQLDTTDAQKAVRDAQSNLESAQLAMDKLKQSSADINQILEDAFADISNAFLDFPTIVSNAQDIIVGSTLNPRNQDNIGFYKDFVGQADDRNYQKALVFIDAASTDYATARAAYDEVFLLYKSTTRYSDSATIQTLLGKTLATTKSLAQALKSEQNLLDYLTDYGVTYSKTLPTLATTYKSTLRTNIGLVNNHLSSLASVNNNIANAPLDIRSQELSIAQRQNALTDAKAALADYYVRAPFDGQLAKLSVKKGDSVSAGTAVATLITPQQIAEISLNEVDIAKVALKQKATLTFDAVTDLTIAGSVVQMDSIGTATQGVVTYKVDIALDTQNDAVKPGMSVSAAIITGTKPDVLLIPNSAVKKQGTINYVLILDAYKTSASQVAITQGVTSAVLPAQQEVTIGSSNDTMTEIVSGLKEGDSVVARTIAATGTVTATTQSGGIGGIRIPGLGGGGRGN